MLRSKLCWWTWGLLIGGLESSRLRFRIYYFLELRKELDRPLGFEKAVVRPCRNSLSAGQRWPEACGGVHSGALVSLAVT